MENKLNDEPFVEEILGGVVARGRAFEVIKRIRESNKGTKVTIICRTPDDEAKCELLSQVAGLEIVEAIRSDDKELLPDGKCVIVINPDSFNLKETADKLADAFAEAFNQRVDAEMEEIIKKMEIQSPEPLLDKYERAYQREQMKQRSRYLSKHCRK